MKRKSKKDEEVDPVNAWWCLDCKTEQMTHPECMAHIRDVHKLETKGLKCNKSMVMHADARTYFVWKYDVTITHDGGEIKLANETITPRAKDDMMRHV